MTEIAHAGYQTVTLDAFLRFVAGEPVELPPHPLLLTFDDARADSWLNGDGTLARLGFHAVMFVDVGRVEDGDPEYMTWPELTQAQDSGRWQLQLHAGHGHVLIRYDDDPAHTGPFYAYEERGESFAGWQRRVQSDIEWGQGRLGDEIKSYAPLAFAPPFGSYGQDGTNDPQIPDTLLGWLSGRYRAVFTQDRNALARPGGLPPLGRIEVTRSTTGGELHSKLLSGEN